MNLLNILLMMALALFSIHTLMPFLYTNIEITLPEAREATLNQEIKQYSRLSPSLADFIIVTEQNVFHPGRRAILYKKGEQEFARPELILYGTLITNDTCVAYVEDKKNAFSSPGRGNRQIVLNKGDVIGGFVLKEIEAEKIILIRGEEKMIVTLYENKTRKPREASSKIPTTSRSPSIRPQFPHVPESMKRIPSPVAVQPPRI
jgi:hypothetical protein